MALPAACGYHPYVRPALQNYRQGVWFEEFGWETGQA